MMKLRLLGRMVEVVRDAVAWKAFCLGREGKKRRANDIVLPENLKEDDLIECLTDPCHEWASPANNALTRLG